MDKRRWNPFVRTERILNVLGLANAYKVRPSTLLSVDDSYTAYCFDEACAIIVSRIENGEKPIFKKNAGMHFTSFREFYKMVK